LDLIWTEAVNHKENHNKDNKRRKVLEKRTVEGTKENRYLFMTSSEGKIEHQTPLSFWIGLRTSCHHMHHIRATHTTILTPLCICLLTKAAEEGDLGRETETVQGKRAADAETGKDKEFTMTARRG